jgi:hypothetical protein
MRVGEVVGCTVHRSSLFFSTAWSEMMGRIVAFPDKLGLRAVPLAAGRKHEIWVRVVDREEPEEARWHLQRPMQRAASFNCLGGFNDAAARSRTWHRFDVSSTALSRRFLHESALLVAEGRVQIEIDGVRVRPTLKRAA